MQEEKRGFEEEIKELEEIVRRLENDPLTLEETVTMYERGTKLAAVCRRLLEEGSAKLTALTQEQGQFAEKEVNRDE